ncbi:hypothetical protein [Actinacidiphila glaucinigra]|uniref:Uncharacterized protein n=1 Tax=Actinacidiphila glaucinigra TaxID=235986 RepID=A0A239F0Y1_9ACTN|nr:hypothetical protein [Actinacidiphila glaucinigra]SNS50670.1 hypothetical protein SAMN05216252_106261 [Actinacidiphila glaucinigra]
MDVTITVRVCDICERRDRPAVRYTLQPENGEARTRDLCAVDVAPVEALFGPLNPEGTEEDAPLRAVVASKPPAKKAAAKTGARRTRRTPITTMEEIEARKVAQASQS